MKLGNFVRLRRLFSCQNPLDQKEGEEKEKLYLIFGFMHTFVNSFSLLCNHIELSFPSMARALVSFYYIMDQLGSIISSEFTLFADVEEEIQKLESKFRGIQTVLNDEEKKVCEAVKVWFKRRIL